MSTAANKLTPADLWSLETYAEQRAAFRQKVIAHKKKRTVHVGRHLTLLFEDRLLVQYQVQEMLRIERIFEKPAIQEELDAYNPLIPDGGNLKATCLIEYEDAEERRRALAKLRGIEHQLWLQVGDGARVLAIADEDLDRANEEKTSAVHFLRFELDAKAQQALKAGERLRIGCDHAAYRETAEVPREIAETLAADLA
jgi:hypothetical protein